MAKHLLALAPLLLLLGCGDKDRDMTPGEDLAAPPDLTQPADLAAPPDLVGPADLSMPPADGGPAAIGTPCSDDSQCKAGPAPVCWKRTVRDELGAPPTPGGYCSSTCIADGDCGAGARCVEVRGASYCLASCRDATTCRHPGYACSFYEAAGVCFPDAIFDCDPTAAMGVCKEAGTLKTGGCVRGAFENKGTCHATCDVGPGTCAPLGGAARQCVFYQSDFPADPYRGTACLPSVPRPRPPGADCRYVNECTDGYQCDSKDSKCRKLCNKGGTPACTAPAVCADAFMTVAAGPGLCR